MNSYARVNDLHLYYEALGSSENPVVLLIGGVGNQAINWEDEFCELLVAKGLYVIRYDARDVGYSTKLHAGREPDFAAIRTGDLSSLEYRLDDMADDAIGLLDALRIDSAHVVGRSMGGAVAEIMAIRHPDRVRSLALLSTSTGARDVGHPHSEALAFSLERPTSPSRDEAIRAIAEGIRRRGSPPPLGLTNSELMARARRDFTRSHYPPGTARHLAAAMAARDLTAELRTLAVPTVVVHGKADAVVDWSGGQALARLIPGATSIFIEDMAHDLPKPVWPLVVEAVTKNIERSANFEAARVPDTGDIAEGASRSLS